MTEYASGGFTGGNGPHGYVHKAKFSLVAPLNAEIEQTASNWVSGNLDDLRDMTTEEVAHEGFVSGVQWLLGDSQDETVTPKICERCGWSLSGHVTGLYGLDCPDRVRFP